MSFLSSPDQGWERVGLSLEFSYPGREGLAISCLSASAHMSLVNYCGRFLTGDMAREPYIRLGVELELELGYSHCNSVSAST